MISGHTSHFLNFSLRHAIVPLLGIWGGLSSISLFFTSKFFLHACTAFGSHLLLAWHLPTCCGTLYFALLKKERLYYRYAAALPACACMLLFWIHPVGRHALLYPLYWILPIVIAIGGYQQPLLQSLGSTFTAHAIGSILWLYGGLLIAPEAWNALIPIVALERCGFACLMTSLIYVTRGTTFLVKNYVCDKITSFGAHKIIKNDLTTALTQPINPHL